MSSNSIMVTKTRIAGYPVWNAVFFQLVWFAAIFWGNVTAFFSVLCFCIIHFLCVEDTNQKKKDLKLSLILVVIGFCIDTSLGMIGIMRWESASPFPMLWLSALWLGFALTINYALGWISKFPRLGILIGAISGCGSYIGGAHLSPYVTIDAQLYSVIILALLWGVIFWFIWYFLPRHLAV